MTVTIVSVHSINTYIHLLLAHFLELSTHIPSETLSSDEGVKVNDSLQTLQPSQLELSVVDSILDAFGTLPSHGILCLDVKTAGHQGLVDFPDEDIIKSLIDDIDGATFLLPPGQRGKMLDLVGSSELGTTNFWLQFQIFGDCCLVQGDQVDRCEFLVPLGRVLLGGCPVETLVFQKFRGTNCRQIGLRILLISPFELQSQKPI